MALFAALSEEEGAVSQARIGPPPLRTAGPHRRPHAEREVYDGARALRQGCRAMTIPIIFCAPPGARAARLRRTLDRHLDLVYLTDLEGLVEACREAPPVAVVLPLPPPAGGRCGDTPLLQF